MLELDLLLMLDELLLNELLLELDLELLLAELELDENDRLLLNEKLVELELLDFELLLELLLELLELLYELALLLLDLDLLDDEPLKLELLLQGPGEKLTTRYGLFSAIKSSLEKNSHIPGSPSPRFLFPFSCLSNINPVSIPVVVEYLTASVTSHLTHAPSVSIGISSSISLFLSEPR